MIYETRRGGHGSCLSQMAYNKNEYLSQKYYQGGVMPLFILTSIDINREKCAFYGQTKPTLAPRLRNNA